MRWPQLKEKRGNAFLCSRSATTWLHSRFAEKHFLSQKCADIDDLVIKVNHCPNTL
jgi:hypothetical protein